ncbi:hypothetical protein ABQX22_14805 [Xanthomonas sp. WHRI 1810A]|uniref:hypothetical protein n=1 Tax=Xanthomonas sp. WHRI 1810A TaxID=3161565 RepID=UPI0032E8805F
MPYTTFSDAQITRLIQTINQQGYAVLPDWASSEQLEQLKTLVVSAVAAAGNDYVALTGSEAVAGTPLQDWGTSRAFIDLCRRIVVGATGQEARDPGLQQTLRCLTGDGGRRESLIFHYDSFVLTTIMPVCMPDDGESGDLLMLPSRRPLRRHYALNLLDKLLVDNRWMQRRLAKRYATQAETFTRIRMLPGNLYLFWGYRSLHTNLPVAQDALRATAVFHYHNVHGSSSLANRIRSAVNRLKPVSVPVDAVNP